MSQARYIQLSRSTNGSATCKFSAVFPFFGDEARTMIMHCSAEQFAAAWESYSAGAMAQDAFSFLSPAEREFIISGMYQSDWDALEGEDNGEE